jgi:hypothetical protein
VGKSLGKLPVGRSRKRLEDNFNMDLRQIGYEDRKQLKLTQDRVQRRAVVLTVLSFQVILPEHCLDT